MAGRATSLDAGRGRTFVLCPWTTVRGNSATAINLVQEPGEWLDMAAFNDATFVIDVANVTNPSGAAPGYVLLYLESSPTPDESTFHAVAGPIVFAVTAANSPIVAKTASAGAAPLARYLRWRVVATGSPSLFDVTFRIRVIANRSFYYAPTQLSGCVLWLRADRGVTFNNQSVRVWMDQSGNGYDASQGTSANQPSFSQTAVNGFPAVQGNGSSVWELLTPSFTMGANATLIAACLPSATTQAGTARLFEHKYNQTYYLGCDSTGTKYKLIVNNGASPWGTAEGGTVALAPTIVTGAYSSSTTVGTLYVNGTSIATGTFTAPSPTSLPLYLLHSADSFSTSWNGCVSEVIIFNRTLTSGEFNQLHRYLGARYGISVP